VYRAAVDPVRAQTRVLKHLLKQVFGGSATSLVLNLVEAGDLTVADLDAIRRKMKQ
jgi:predicted transcriptional regulator